VEESCCVVFFWERLHGNTKREVEVKVR